MLHTTRVQGYKCNVQVKYEIDVCNARIAVCSSVYEPSDDTWALLECVEKLGGGSIAIDLGAGTGVAAACLASRYAYVVAIDIDSCAVSCMKRAKLPFNVDIVQCDNLTCIRRVRGLAIAYNTPYLPVSKEELAWSGGPREAIRTLWAARTHPESRTCIVFSTLTPSRSVFNEASRLAMTWRVVDKREGTLFEWILSTFFADCVILSGECKQRS